MIRTNNNSNTTTRCRHTILQSCTAITATSSSIKANTDINTNTNTNTKQQRQRRYKSTLILLRHGKSVWNGGGSGALEDGGSHEARFSGWEDVPLTVEGRVEAVAAGLLLRHRGIKSKSVCVAFASELQRSHETCELVLASMAGGTHHQDNSWSSSRIRRDWKLNERHWGILQGRYKNDPELIEKYGKQTLLEWRRSLKGKPPPLVDKEDHVSSYRRRSNKKTNEHEPLTESLYDCQRRVVDCWENTISKTLFEEENLPYPPEQRTIMVVAHANTIRALMAHFDDVKEDQIPNLFVPNSVPILYQFDSSTRKPVEDKLELGSSVSGSGDGNSNNPTNTITSHARWMLSMENHIHIRNAIAQGGMLTRALFDFMDVTKDGKVCLSDLEISIRELQNPNNKHYDDDDNNSHIHDCVVVDVAKKCAFDMKPNEYITFEEFERRTQYAYKEIQYYCDSKTDVDDNKNNIEWI